MCLSSLSLPGLGGFPSANQRSLDLPPIHARVVKPSTSKRIPHFSSHREMTSAVAATQVMGPPLRLPELSSSRQTDNDGGVRDAARTSEISIASPLCASAIAFELCSR